MFDLCDDKDAADALLLFTRRKLNDKEDKKVGMLSSCLSHGAHIAESHRSELWVQNVLSKRMKQEQYRSDIA